MWKTIKTLFAALTSLLSIIITFIGLGDKAAKDAVAEYDSWSDRRKQTKADLKDFYQQYDAVEEITDRIQEVNSMDADEATKSQLLELLNTELAKYIEPTE